MPGLIPNDGENLIANMIFKNVDANRGTSLQLGLFTNATGVDETITLASITEPTGGGYARITLADASWSVVADLASYAMQTFTATGSAYVGAIYGYFIATTGTTPKLLAIEIDPVGPYTMAQNDVYDITPNITVA
jgi:hypothetical protein